MINEFSDKQKKSYIESNARINIWEGAVRSGKTYISLIRWLKELRYGPDGEYCMISRTYDSFKRNLLPLLSQMIGADSKFYIGKRELSIWGKTIHCVSADDESSEKKIRGSTMSGCYIDEATIIPESVFKMAISRCAMGDAKIFATTNPDSPFHWLKRDYLTSNPDVKSWQFTLEDNPALNKDEKDYLCRQYKGIWYKRFIEGLWVQAEGSIYDMFDKSMHTIATAPGLPEYSIVGVDYGTTNPCAFVSLSVNTNKYPNMWVDNVYYWDSRAQQRQKTDSEYCADLKRFIDGKAIKAIYIDPSAASFKLECQRAGIPCICDAENEVLDGIRMVGKYFDNGTLKIMRHCEELIKEIQSYVWDPKSQRTGEDSPLKSHDHACVTGDTIVLTDKGYQRIDTIGTSGLIASQIGLSVEMLPYVNPTLTRQQADIFELTLEDGSKIKATWDHKFLTESGWKCLQDLTDCDTVYTWNTNSFKI